MIAYNLAASTRLLAFRVFASLYPWPRLSSQLNGLSES